MMPMMLNPLHIEGFPWYLVLFVGVIMFVRTYMQGPRCPDEYMVSGKVIIVTGATSGIGKYTAQELARRGGKIVLACRDLDKAKAVAAEIIEETGNDQVTALYLDLASFKAIKDFVKEFSEKFSCLDVLINNAAVMFHPFLKTEDHNELHFQVNYLGQFLLTLLLLDKLRASAAARIINVSALAHWASSIDLGDLNQENHPYSPHRAYGQSKIAMILFTRELAIKLRDTKITVNSLHPGITRGTELPRYSALGKAWLQIPLFPLMWILMKSIRDASQTSIYLASCPEIRDVTGQYFSDCEPRRPSADAQNPEYSRALWKKSLTMVGLDEEDLGLAK